jgi:hypothetical protein
VTHVELVLAPQDLLAVLVAAQQRPQQELAHAEGEHEDADDAGAVALEAVDRHRGHRAGDQLPRDDREEDAAEHLAQRAAAHQHEVAGDDREVQDVEEAEDDEHGDRVAVAADRGVVVQRAEDQPAQQRHQRVGRRVAEQRQPARARVQGIHQHAADADRDRRRRSQDRHREDQAHERARDPDALGLERQEVAAPRQHGEQADQLRGLPLLGGRHQSRRRDAAEQHAGLDAGDDPAPPARPQKRGVAQDLALRTHPRLAVSGPGRAHQGEGPRHDDEPKNDR